MTAKCSPPPLLVLVAAACLATLVAGHSSLVSPISRNAVDRNLRPWQGGRFGNNQSCAHPSRESENDADIRARFGLCWGCNCVNSTGTCDVAQTCLWVSVAACRSVFFSVIYALSICVCFQFSEGCSIGCDSCDGGESNPNTKDRCGKGMKPTNNDPYFRTYNRNVTAMSEKDM